ncbi:MAG: ABC transporter ATP-binding protein [Negativicutes bacterium]|nr:ABC transporter ATP-binding protein [Negativicutes bacterium]
MVFDSVCKNYGAKPVVNNFSLTVNDREFVVFVGPSGCGKSTTLRMLAGLEAIDSGTIAINGRVVNDVPPKDRDVAMVFQNYALYPHMTVFDNMAASLRWRGADRAAIREKVLAAAKILQIDELLDRRPHQLSGGQKQRVAMGRAIVRQPAVFLMDEPLSNLDAKLRGEVRTEIIKLQRNLKTTTVYVTHDQTEAMTMGDRIVVIRDGVIQQVADPLTLYLSPQNTFVAGFIGAPAMNFLPAETQWIDEFCWLNLLGVKLALPAGLQSVVARHPYRQLTVGIRPEYFRLADDPSLAETFSVRVVLSEMLGADTIVHCDHNDQSVVVKLSGQFSFRSGEVVHLSVDKSRINLFAAHDGNLLT